MPRKKETKSKKPPVGSETSESIALQTAEFLKSGGEVDIIQRGVSGREPTEGRKHITYAKK